MTAPDESDHDPDGPPGPEWSVSDIAQLTRGGALYVYEHADGRSATVYEPPSRDFPPSDWSLLADPSESAARPPGPDWDLIDAELVVRMVYQQQNTEDQFAFSYEQPRRMTAAERRDVFTHKPKSKRQPPPETISIAVFIDDRRLVGSKEGHYVLTTNETHGGHSDLEGPYSDDVAKEIAARRDSA